MAKFKVHAYIIAATEAAALADCAATAAHSTKTLQVEWIERREP
jgi:hypothetical protein